MIYFIGCKSVTTGEDMENIYVVSDNMSGNVIFRAIENSTCLQRTCCGENRKFRMPLFAEEDWLYPDGCIRRGSGCIDDESKAALVFHRPLVCQRCCIQHCFTKLSQVINSQTGIDSVLD